MTLTLCSCSSDSNDEASNQAPEAFSLIGVTDADGAIEVDVKPTFSWNAAIDPEGDAITYDLLIDTNNNPTTIVANNISGTTFTLQDRLPLVANLFWKVIATDTAGNTSMSDILNFTTRNLRIPSVPVTNAAGFSGRGNHTSVVFNDKIWVVGGWDGISRKNDVWSSPVGVTWTQVTTSAPFLGRTAHTSLVFDNKIWVIGGGGTYLNDVWAMD